VRLAVSESPCLSAPHHHWRNCRWWPVLKSVTLATVSAFPIDKVHRLYNSLLLPYKPWQQKNWILIYESIKLWIFKYEYDANLTFLALSCAIISIPEVFLPDTSFCCKCVVELDLSPIHRHCYDLLLSVKTECQIKGQSEMTWFGRSPWGIGKRAKRERRKAGGGRWINGDRAGENHELYGCDWWMITKPVADASTHVAFVGEEGTTSVDWRVATH